MLDTSIVLIETALLGGLALHLKLQGIEITVRTSPTIPSE
jgi:hypothetical protein